MPSRSIVPYRNSVIGGRPATASDFIPRSSSTNNSYSKHPQQNYSMSNGNSSQGYSNNKKNYYSYQQPSTYTQQQGNNNNSCKVYQNSNWKQNNSSSNNNGNSSANNTRFSSPIQQQSNAGHNHGQMEQGFVHMQGSGGQQGTMAGFPAEMFQPKTTTYIRKLDPSEVFGEGSEMNDFDFGGLVLDSNNVIIQPPQFGGPQHVGFGGQNGSSCKAIVPFKADNDNTDKGQKAYSSVTGGQRSMVKLISPDQADDKFHFSPEDFENGQTTYFPASTLMQQFGPIKSGPFKQEKSEMMIMNGGGGFMPQQNAIQHQSFAANNGMSYANRMRSQSLDRKFTNPQRRQSMTHGCASPEYPNNYGYSNIHYEINNGKNLESSHSCGDALDEEEPDNRTTYGFAEFQAARQRFENNCKQNQAFCNGGMMKSITNSQQKKITNGYRSSIANPYSMNFEEPAIPLTNRSNFCTQSSCNHGANQGGQQALMGPTITTHGKDLDDVNAIQQYVVAEEGGPGCKTKIFSFPAGEAPGDLTLLRAAVAANQPEDPYILEEFQDEGGDENQKMQKALPMMRAQQSFSSPSQGFPFPQQQQQQQHDFMGQKKPSNQTQNRHRNSIAISQGNFCMQPSQQTFQSLSGGSNTQNNMVPMQQPFPNMHQMVMPTSSNGGNSNFGGYACKSMSPMSNMFMNSEPCQQNSGSNNNSSPYYTQNHDCSPYNNNVNATYLSQSKNLI